MKRVRLTQRQYRELIEARDWCARRGHEGFRVWYDELLSDHGYRRTLPVEVMEARAVEEQDDHRGRRRD
jgi:hypothetical protein